MAIELGGCRRTIRAVKRGKLPRKPDDKARINVVSAGLPNAADQNLTLAAWRSLRMTCAARGESLDGCGVVVAGRGNDHNLSVGNLAERNKVLPCLMISIDVSVSLTSWPS